MCTAFVKYGKDYICGFNMDINAGAIDWRLLMDDQVFAVACTPLEPSGIIPGDRVIPPELPCGFLYLRKAHAAGR